MLRKVSGCIARRKLTKSSSGRRKFSRLFASAEEYPAKQEYPTLVNRKAVLVFAHPLGLDLARRRLPRFLRPLLSLRRLQGAALAADFHLFTSGKISAPPGFQVHEQKRENFAERLEAALEEIARLGYEEVVLVGSDCPNLQSADIAVAFARLAGKRLVLGPDHRGGCYLIGLRTAERNLLRNIRWNRDRDRAQLSRRVDSGALALLPVKQDLDSWADLRLLARAGHRLAQLAATLFPMRKDARGFFVDLPAMAVRARTSNAHNRRR